VVLSAVVEIALYLNLMVWAKGSPNGALVEVSILLIDLLLEQKFNMTALLMKKENKI
jgi:hypothetical protein